MSYGDGVLQGVLMGVMAMGAVLILAMSATDSASRSEYCPPALEHTSDTLALVTDLPACAELLEADDG